MIYLSISLASLWIGFAWCVWLHRDICRELDWQRRCAGFWFRHYQSVCEVADED